MLAILPHELRATDEDGCEWWEVCAPVGCSAQRLVFGVRGLRWSLHEVCLADDDEGVEVDFDAAYEVPYELRTLINSARQYAPAFALARSQVERRRWPDGSTRNEVLEAFAERLRHHLEQQPHAKYVLARAKAAVCGYLSEGDFVWVLQVSREPATALWVSDDYYTYRDPVAVFDLDAAAIKSLRANVQPYGV
jgi:hypothetical protein